ncbi:ABC transporter ATP-binding protein, partial [Candidatus Entotheonella serta]
EHTGNLMSKATADVESVRRFVSQGLVRSLDVSVRLIAITTILIFLNWKLALLSLICIPFIVLRATLVLRRLRAMWLHVQALLGELSTVLQENLVGIHVVKAFAAEAHEQAKYDAKSQELRREYVES